MQLQASADITRACFQGLWNGIGTLDELIETMTLQKLDKYNGRLVLFNYEGFFNPLLALLDHYVATGMLAPKDRALIEAYDTEESLLASF